MLDPRPTTLAVVGAVVLLGGVAAVSTADEGPLPDEGEATTEQPDLPADPPAGSGTDAGAGPDGSPSTDEPAAGKGGTAGGTDEVADDDLSPTERTLQDLLERDVSDAVDTYQDLGARDPE